MTQEALTLALAAFYQIFESTPPYRDDGTCVINDKSVELSNKAIAAIKEALAQEQEPVAWRTFDGEGGYDYRSYEDNESYADDWNKRNPNHAGWVDKLYTHSQPEQEPVADDFFRMIADRNPKPFSSPPRTWIGLEGEEIRNSWEEATKPDRSTMTIVTSFARAIEAKLKDKNCAG